MEEYKHLGSIINHKQTFRNNTDLIIMKYPQLCFLHKLQQLEVSSSVNLQQLHSISVLAWFGSLSEMSKCPLNRIFKTNEAIGTSLTTLSPRRVVWQTSHQEESHSQPWQLEWSVTPREQISFPPLKSKHLLYLHLLNHLPVYILFWTIYCWKYDFAWP